MISVINQKGGVGKTTTVLNLGYALSDLGKRLLVIDLDPQSHLTAGFGIHDARYPGADALLKDEVAFESVKRTIKPGLDLLPSGSRLSECESNRLKGVVGGSKLKKFLETQKGNYDLVLIDCPPSAGMLAMNAILASGEMIIPVASDYLSLHGLSRLLSAVTNIEGIMKLNVRKHILVTRYSAHRKLAVEVRRKVTDYFPGQVMPTVIRESVALAESPSFGCSIFDYKKSSIGANDYMQLAHELVNVESWRDMGLAQQNRAACK